MSVEEQILVNNREFASLRRIARLATDLTYQANRHSSTLWASLKAELVRAGYEPEKPHA